MEGDNITLEWTYSFRTGSFRQLLFIRNVGILDIVDKFAGSNPPLIYAAYKGRLLVNVTDKYASITFLEVKRTDSTGYTLKIINYNGVKKVSQVDISVQCKYENQFTQVYFFGYVYFFSRVRGWKRMRA